MAVVVALVVAVVAVVVVNRGEGDGETQSSVLPPVHAQGLTGFGGSRPSALARTGSLFPGALGAMATSYARIELKYCLDIGEVAELMIAASGGWMNSFRLLAKESGHYSAHDWIVEVKMPGTASGLGEQVTIGITDFESFGRLLRFNGRRKGHQHFWARGRDSAVLQVVDFFKAAIPSTLWHCEFLDVKERRGWAKVEAGTIIPKITVAEARTAAWS